MKTCPHGKEWWPTQELADAALEDIWARPRGHWHLTSQGESWVARPSQSELWRRNQVALSLLADGGDPAALLERVRLVLLGKTRMDGAA